MQVENCENDEKDRSQEEGGGLSVGRGGCGGGGGMRASVGSPLGKRVRLEERCKARVNVTDAMRVSVGLGTRKVPFSEQVRLDRSEITTLRMSG